MGFVHLRVNFWPAITGAAAVDLEFALPHIAHADQILAGNFFMRGAKPTICFVGAFLAIGSSLF